MAVAAHVSRVAKDYAPFGYSIMESVSATVTTDAAGTGSTVAQLLLTDDDDIYIESINVLGITAVTADNTNYLTISVASMDSGGGHSAAHSTAETKATDPIFGSNIVANTAYRQTVLTPQVAKSRLLQLKVDKATAHANTNSKTLTICVRYRRKA